MPKTTSIPKEIKAQRYPLAPWLYVVGAGNWWRFKRPSPDWVPLDADILTNPNKRKVLEACGGFEVWWSVIVEASKQGIDGLFERDPAWLQRRLGLSDTGTEVLIEAGWLLWLTDEQAEVVRGGQRIQDWGKEPKERPPDTETENPKEAGCAAYLAGKPEATAGEVAEFLLCSTASVYRLAAWKNRRTATVAPSHGDDAENSAADKVGEKSGPKNGPGGTENRATHKIDSHKGKERKEKRKEKKAKQTKDKAIAQIPENKASAQNETPESDGGCSTQPPGVPGDAETENLTQSDAGQAKAACGLPGGSAKPDGLPERQFDTGGDETHMGGSVEAVCVWANPMARVFAGGIYHILTGLTAPKDWSTAPVKAQQIGGAFAHRWHKEFEPQLNGDAAAFIEHVFEKLHKKRQALRRHPNPGGSAMTTVRRLLAGWKQAGKGVG